MVGSGWRWFVPCRRPACPVAVGAGTGCGVGAPRGGVCPRPCPGCSGYSPPSPTAIQQNNQ